MPGKPGEKRKKVEIDLTADSDNDAPPQKAQRPNVASSRPVPASSAPRSSYHGGYEYVYGAPTSTLRHGQHSETERKAWRADEQDDVTDLVFSSTQAAAADTELLHHFANLHSKIVGVRFYNGHANPGEQILMKREPGNPYDSNAIRIDNVQNMQIGHIPRQIASKLATFMDNSYLHCEGELAGHIGQFDCPLLIRLFGPDPQTEEGALLATELKQAKVPLDALKAAETRRKEAEKARQKAEKDRMIEEKRQLALARKAAAQSGSGSGVRIPSNSQYGFASQSQPGPSSQPIMADVMEASQRFNPREIGNSTDQYGMQEEGLEKMPKAKQPASIKTQMLPYQLQALQWLLDQESPRRPAPGAKDAVQLWKRDNRSNLFTNIATNYSVRDPPELASGGILADDMGLGKTLEMMSLLVADNEKAGHRTGTTLIVAPLSVMSNWSSQCTLHMHEDAALKIYTYHGSGRVNMRPADFSQYDLVVTTYQTLATDYMPQAKKGANAKMPEKKVRDSGLYSMEWRRVILDEGHIIRNPRAKAAAAVTALMSKSRWVLTGTPIVNSLRDLYSILRFIGVSGGLQNLEIFNRVLVRPLKQGDPSAALLLKAVMTAFTLRRRKEMRFVDLRLPELEEYIHRVQFTDKERQRYDALGAEAKGLLNKYEKKARAPGGGAGQAFAHLLEILLRMRQCCNHWQLCGERVTNLLAQISDEKKTVDLTPENEKALQDMLQLSIESQDDCPICLETLHEPVITTCAHSFGKTCISKVLETQGKCPMCRAELKEEMLVSPRNDCGDETPDDDLDLTQSSTKLEEMMQILNASRDTGNKTVIFSQWTRFLNIVQSRLDREGFKYCRIDGTMPAGQRDASLKSLAEDDDCTIMLASLGVCAVGLNLTAANQIILSDTWWAPAIEDQAVDRVHRLGQKKETRVWRLVMDGTIEEQTIEIQVDKRKLMQLAFSEKGGKREKAKTGRLADIQRLLGAGQKCKKAGEQRAVEEGTREGEERSQ